MRSYEPIYYERAKEGGDLRVFPRKQVLEFINARALDPVSVLDIGCGTSEILEGLPEAVSYIGVDRSEYAIAKAGERWKNDRRKIRFILLDGYQMPFDSGKFDFLLLLFSIEHARDPKGLLKECGRLLKRNGFLIILAPNLEFPLAWPAALRHRSIAYQIWFHIVRSFDYLMRLAGVYSFRVVDKNFTDATGAYERKDDDLRVLVSSWEVVRFLEGSGFALEEFWKEREVVGFRRFVQKLPALRWYGMTLAAAFRKI